MFQNETHFIFNPLKGKMNQVFDQEEFISDFPKKFKGEWKEVQNKIYDIVKKLYALSVHEAPGLKDDKVGKAYFSGKGTVRNRHHH